MSSSAPKTLKVFSINNPGVLLNFSNLLQFVTLVGDATIYLQLRHQFSHMRTDHIGN